MEESKQKMEEQNKSHVSLVRTIKDRKRVEMEYLDAVKKQMWYWKTQIDATDPEEDEDRYNELKENIKREEEHIEMVQNELNRINEELIEMENK